MCSIKAHNKLGEKRGNENGKNHYLNVQFNGMQQ